MSFTISSSSSSSRFFVNYEGYVIDPFRKEPLPEQKKERYTSLSKSQNLLITTTDSIPEKKDPFIDLPCSESECDAIRKVFSSYPQIQGQLSVQDLSEVLINLIPNLVRVKNYLTVRYHHFSHEKPGQLKISGKNNAILSFISKNKENPGIRHKGSVKILFDGTILYSFPRYSSIKGGLKKITFKLISHINIPNCFSAIAKLTPLQKKEIRDDKEMLQSIEKSHLLSQVLNHPNVVFPSILLRKKHTFPQKEDLTIAYMDIMPPISDVFHEIIPNRIIDLPSSITYLVTTFMSLITDTIEGAAYIDSQGYVHNDIKPDNILVKREITQEGWRYIACLNDIDFITTHTAAENGENTLSGTKEYFLPGETRGSHSDIYALGITIQQLTNDFFEQFFKRISNIQEKHCVIHFINKNLLNKLYALSLKMTAIDSLPYIDFEDNLVEERAYNNYQISYKEILSFLRSLNKEFIVQFNTAFEKQKPSPQEVD